MMETNTQGYQRRDGDDDTTNHRQSIYMMTQTLLGPTDDERCRRLSRAVSNNDTRLVVDLLNHGTVSVNARDPACRGRSALLIAIQHGHLEALQVLLDKGADVTLVDDDDVSALDLCQQFDSRNTEMAQLLFHSVERDSISVEQKLLQASWQANYNVVNEILESTNIRPSSAAARLTNGENSATDDDDDDMSYEDNDEVDNRAVKIDCRNAQGASPLMLSSVNADYALEYNLGCFPGFRAPNPQDTMRRLVDSGANVNARDKKGSTVLHRTVKVIGKFVNDKLKKSSKQSNNNPNDEEEDDDAESTFEMLNTSRKKDILSSSVTANYVAPFLVNEKHADVNRTDGSSSLPLHSTCELNLDDISCLLLDANSETNVRRKQDGRTPTHIAASKSNYDITRKLIDCGADLTVLDNDNRTPYDVAVGDAVRSAVREAWAAQTAARRSKSAPRPLSSTLPSPTPPEAAQVWDDLTQRKSGQLDPIDINPIVPNDDVIDKKKPSPQKERVRRTQSSHQERMKEHTSPLSDAPEPEPPVRIDIQRLQRSIAGKVSIGPKKLRVVSKNRQEVLEIPTIDELDKTTQLAPLKRENTEKISLYRLDSGLSTDSRRSLASTIATTLTTNGITLNIGQGLSAYSLPNPSHDLAPSPGNLIARNGFNQLIVNGTGASSTASASRQGSGTRSHRQRQLAKGATTTSHLTVARRGYLSNTARLAALFDRQHQASATGKSTISTRPLGEHNIAPPENMSAQEQESETTIVASIAEQNMATNANVTRKEISEEMLQSVDTVCDQSFKAKTTDLKPNGSNVTSNKGSVVNGIREAVALLKAESKLIPQQQQQQKQSNVKQTSGNNKNSAVPNKQQTGSYVKNERPRKPDVPKVNRGTINNATTKRLQMRQQTKSKPTAQPKQNKPANLVQHIPAVRVKPENAKLSKEKHAMSFDDSGGSEKSVFDKTPRDNRRSRPDSVSIEPFISPTVTMAIEQARNNANGQPVGLVDDLLREQSENTSKRSERRRTSSSETPLCAAKPKPQLKRQSSLKRPNNQPKVTSNTRPLQKASSMTALPANIRKALHTADGKKASISSDRDRNNSNATGKRNRSLDSATRRTPQLAIANCPPVASTKSSPRVTSKTPSKTKVSTLKTLQNNYESKDSDNDGDVDNALMLSNILEESTQLTESNNHISLTTKPEDSNNMDEHNNNYNSGNVTDEDEALDARMRRQLVDDTPKSTQRESDVAELDVAMIKTRRMRSIDVVTTDGMAELKDKLHIEMVQQISDESEKRLAEKEVDDEITPLPSQQPSRHGSFGQQHHFKHGHKRILPNNSAVVHCSKSPRPHDVIMSNKINNDPVANNHINHDQLPSPRIVVSEERAHKINDNADIDEAAGPQIQSIISLCSCNSAVSSQLHSRRASFPRITSASSRGGEITPRQDSGRLRRPIQSLGLAIADDNNSLSDRIATPYSDTATTTTTDGDGSSLCASSIFSAASCNSPQCGKQQKLTWKQGRRLGVGGFGTVYLGRTADNRFVAIKILHFDGGIRGANYDRWVRMHNEIEILSRFRHRNIVNYIGRYDDMDDEVDGGRWTTHIFMEYLACGTIADTLRDYGHLSETSTRQYTRQLTGAIAFLHEHHVVHRDIKTSNVMLEHHRRTGTSYIKLIDFGNAESVAPSPGGTLQTCGSGSQRDVIESSLGLESNDARPRLLRNVCGSPSWMAPEIYALDGNQDAGYDGKASDVWALALTVYAMSVGVEPWTKFTNAQVACAQLPGNPLPRIKQTYPLTCSDEGLRYLKFLPENQEYSESARDFVDMAIRRDPSERPTAAMLLEHPFIAPKTKRTKTDDQ